MASGETHLPERIRTRSEALWEEAGRPDGRPGSIYPPGAVGGSRGGETL
jgi:hypothetical protein